MQLERRSAGVSPVRSDAHVGSDSTRHSTNSFSAIQFGLLQTCRSLCTSVKPQDSKQQPGCNANSRGHQHWKKHAYTEPWPAAGAVAAGLRCRVHLAVQEAAQRWLAMAARLAGSSTAAASMPVGCTAAVTACAGCGLGHNQREAAPAADRPEQHACGPVPQTAMAAANQGTAAASAAAVACASHQLCACRLGSSSTEHTCRMAGVGLLQPRMCWRALPDPPKPQRVAVQLLPPEAPEPQLLMQKVEGIIPTCAAAGVAAARRTGAAFFCAGCC